MTFAGLSSHMGLDFVKSSIDEDNVAEIREDEQNVHRQEVIQPLGKFFRGFRVTVKKFSSYR